MFEGRWEGEFVGGICSLFMVCLFELRVAFFFFIRHFCSTSIFLSPSPSASLVPSLSLSLSLFPFLFISPSTFPYPFLRREQQTSSRTSQL